MKKKYKTALLMLAVYLICSPVLFQVEYVTSANQYHNKKIEYAVSAWNRPYFHYYLLFSTYQDSLESDSLVFWVKDYDKTVRSFEILNATATIDGEPLIIASAANTVLEMDRSQFNGYAGRIGVASYRLPLARLPKEHITFSIEGVLHDDSGDRTPESLSMAYQVQQERTYMPLFFYLFIDDFKYY